MKRQTLLLLLVGTIGMSFTLFTRHFIEVPDALSDFFKGLGLAFVIFSIVCAKKTREDHAAVNMVGPCTVSIKGLGWDATESMISNNNANAVHLSPGR